MRNLHGYVSIGVSTMPANLEDVSFMDLGGELESPRCGNTRSCSVIHELLPQ